MQARACARTPGEKVQGPVAAVIKRSSSLKSDIAAVAVATRLRTEDESMAEAEATMISDQGAGG